MLLVKRTATRRIVGILFFALSLLFVENALGASSISGTVYDKQRNSLSDVDVELLNDLYQQIRRARTDGTGRYAFEGLGDGRYTVRVLAFRYDLEDQSQPLEINTVDIRGTQGTSFQVLDFYMLPKKGGLADSELGVVFAQAVPPEAKKVYENALENLSKKRSVDGILELNKAVGLFPNYYMALHRLGRELFVLKKYQDSAAFFFKAVEVNPKSATSFYYLGYALHNLGSDYSRAALAALNQSLTLAPASAPVLYILGKIERMVGDLPNAEKHLLLAKKFSKVPVPEIHKELAQLYANDLKRYDDAATELEIYLKNGKPTEAESSQMKKLISDLRVKAKSQSSNK